MSSGPLAGIRIVDFCSFINGAYGTMLMGDLGADVIKVEALAGDFARAWSPSIAGEGRFFQGWNRSKRGIAVDIASPQGREIVHDLVRGADVVTENFRGGVTRRLQIDYATLRDINPRLIYCTSTGFGGSGPMAERPAYDPVLQSMSGVVRDNQRTVGKAGVGAVAISDYMAAMMVFAGIASALYHRERTGEGQHIETSLLQAVMSASSHFYVRPLDQEEEGGTGIYPYRLFETMDDLIFVGAATDKFWRSFCTAVGANDLGTNPAYARNVDRVRHMAGLTAVLQPILKSKTTAEWEAILLAAEVPCGPVRTYREFFDEPQVTAMAMNPVIEHPVAGRLQVAGVPIVFEKTPGAIQGPAPLLGQHTREVLMEAGYTLDRIAALETSGVIRCAEYRECS